VQNKPAQGSWSDIASALSYAPTGQLSSITFGNSVTTSNTFNAAALYRLISKTTTLPSGTRAQDFAYTYDPVGNITQLTNNATTTNSASITYQYDALNRVIAATTISAVSSPYNQLFSYDPLGNILSITTDTSSSSSKPTIIATSTDRAPGLSISDSFAFNAGATSSNTLLLFAFEGSGGVPTSATYNGQSLTVHSWTGQYAYDAIGYLTNPAPGSHTFSTSYPNQSQPLYRVLVLNNINQSTPIDTDGESTANATSSCSKTLTTTGNDLLFASTITNNTTNNLAWWKFDESSGNASDASGNGNTLTNNNAASFVSGKINNAVKVVRSSSQYLSRTSALGTTVGGPITISTWINLTSLPAAGQAYDLAVVGSGTQSPYVYYILDYENNGGTLQLNFNRSQACVKNNPQLYSVSFSTGAWHHIVMTYDGTNVAGYVDGAQVSQQAQSGNGVSCAPDGWSSVGAGVSGGSVVNGSDGTIDETGVWSRALTSTEVSQLYNSGAGQQYPFSSSITEGSGQTELWQTQPYGTGSAWAGATKSAPATGSQSMSFNYSTSTGACDEAMTALKADTTQGLVTTTVYTYGQTGYANPDALTSINNGISTTTYTYDANGNVTQAGGWTYVWDYLNRMLASGYNNSTTYAYDQSGARVLQTSTTSTTYYPSKYFSLASTTNGGTSWATSTNYIWLGDTLLGTIDQKLYNGTATGTAISRYVHPDHLGSTNVVTDASGMIAQLLDYYPYGATRVSSSTFPTNEKRQYIGRYSDTSGLSYLNARYYNPAQGQFLSEDPVFWGKQNLADPQSFNIYSYANDNPISRSDPNGLATIRGTASEVLSQLKSQLQSAAAFLASLSTSAGRTQFTNNVAGGASIVRSNPIGVASAYGSAIKQGISQTYADLYYGDDATQNKALASTFLFLASLPASELAGSRVATLARVEGEESVATQVISKTHANSLDYDGVSYGYTLRDKATDAIGKFGETISPDTRYSQKWLNANNLYLQIEISGTKAETHAWQNQSILGYKDMYNATPLLNKTNW
jgi:RHS repeat-associated protein